MTSRPTTDPFASYRIAAVFTFSMMVSLVIYAGVVEFMSARGRPAPVVEHFAAIRLAIVGLGLVMTPIARVFRQSVLRKSPADSLETLLAKLTRATAVTLALCEIPVVMGLVLFFIGGRKVDFYLMALMSLVMFLVYFPRMSSWKEWLGPSVHETHGWR